MSIRVLHCITSLSPDGAQQMLLKLISSSDREQFEWKVLNLSTPEKIGDKLESLGVEVVNLSLKSNKNPFSALREYFRIINSFQPHCIQAWMYHANLFVTVANLIGHLPGVCKTIKEPSVKRTHSVPIIWNIRRGIDKEVHDKLYTKIVIKINSLLSRLPHTIIYCANTCRTQHEALGFYNQSGKVIPNGFEIDRFVFDVSRRRLFRQQLGIRDSEFLLGTAGRFHEQKDFPNFIRAAAEAAAADSRLRFVMAGRGVDAENHELLELANTLGLKGKLNMIGQCEDMVGFYSALDAYCLSSITEGFPNVVGEAMSVGVPCIVTDAGGAGEIVQGVGIVVERRNSKALGEAVLKLFSMSPDAREALGKAGQSRVHELYSMRACTQHYQELYEQIVSI